MTKEQLAGHLNGREYPLRLTNDITRAIVIDLKELKTWKAGL